MLTGQEIGQALRAARIVPFGAINPHGPLGLEQLAASVTEVVRIEGDAMSIRPFPWKCHTCLERQVNPARVDYTTELEHDGRVYCMTVNDLDILRCTACQAQVLPDEAHERIMDALRLQAGLFTPAQITEKRTALGFNQKEFAHLLGVALETVSRWETGAQIQQRVMNDFMRAFFDVPQLRDYLKQLRGAPHGLLPAVAPNIPVTAG